MEPAPKTAITGPLQERILMLLNYKPQCGKELMIEIGLKSPGTIYPVLEELRKKELIDYRLDASGSVRKKTYELTSKGKRYVRGNLLSSAKMFCCDASLYVDTIIRDAKQFVRIKRNQKILCTVEYEGLKRFLGGADVTYTDAVEDVTDLYDLIMAFPGVGCLVGRDKIAIPIYYRTLYQRLKSEGSIFIVDIEKTDNLFANIFFRDIRKLKRSPGMDAEELAGLLRSAGFSEVEVHRKSGLLYAVGSKS